MLEHETKECPKCGGSGLRVVQKSASPYSIWGVYETECCPDCNGTGRVKVEC